MTKQFEETERGTYFLSNISGERLKKIAKSTKLTNEAFTDEWLNKLSFNVLYKKKLSQIKKKEPLVFNLINKSKIKGARICYFKDRVGKDWIKALRFELVYKNKIVIKINELLYLACKNKLKTHYSNF